MSPLATRIAVRATTALATTALLAGCGAITGEEGGQRDQGREVVASFYPLAWVTERVAGDDWKVTNLTTPGGEPHDVELSIQATAALSDAELVVYLDGFQPAVDGALDANGEGATLDAAEVVELQPVANRSEEGRGADEDEDRSDLDPHFWLDPARMAVLAEAVGGELAALDAANADQYRSAAADLAAELTTLDQAYANGLAGCERDVIVVSHDAFGYLAKYGLRLEPIAGLSPDAEPSPAALAGLSTLISEEGLTTVFSERLASPAMAKALAADLDISTGVLDPLEGLTDETAQEDYMSLMRQNLTALQEANGC